MINPHDANAMLHAQLLDVLLKVRPILTDDEMHCLCYGCGISTALFHPETSAQQAVRMARDLIEVELRA